MPELALFKNIVARIEKIPDDVFKQVFLDYLGTNEKDIGWEGFKPEHVQGFEVVLCDFLLAFEAGGLSDGKTTCKICELRVKPRGLAMHVMRAHHMGKADYEKWRYAC